MQKAITCNLSGRFGNRLITYLVAKWIAQKNQLSFLYEPFTYSDQFVFHTQEFLYRSNLEGQFKQTIMLKSESEIPHLQKSTLILINLFYVNLKNPKYFKMSYNNYCNDPAFRKFARQLLQPRHTIKTIKVKNRLNVLVHVRTGGGFDRREIQLRLPLKFPPHSFYIAALKTISERFGHPMIYAYIMTDDLNPKAIAEKYSAALADLKNIDFGYRTEEPGPNS